MLNQTYLRAFALAVPSAGITLSPDICLSISGLSSKLTSSTRQAAPRGPWLLCQLLLCPQPPHAGWVECKRQAPHRHSRRHTCLSLSALQMGSAGRRLLVPLQSCCSEHLLLFRKSVPPNPGGPGFSYRHQDLSPPSLLEGEGGGLRHQLRA